MPSAPCPASELLPSVARFNHSQLSCALLLFDFRYITLAIPPEFDPQHPELFDGSVGRELKVLPSHATSPSNIAGGGSGGGGGGSSSIGMGNGGTVSTMLNEGSADTVDDAAAVFVDRLAAINGKPQDAALLRRLLPYLFDAEYDYPRCSMLAILPTHSCLHRTPTRARALTFALTGTTSKRSFGANAYPATLSSDCSTTTRPFCSSCTMNNMAAAWCVHA